MHQTSIPQRLPVELLLLIFEHASDRLSGKVDLDAIVRPAAHVPLVSCALVCRSWSCIAQRVLFRDLVLSRADYAQNGKPAPGIACVLRELMHTLAANHTLAFSVDFLHVDVGRPSCLAAEGNEIIALDCGSHDNDAHLADVAALIALCSRVRHVSLTLESTPREGAVFCDADLGRLKAASSSVRHFTYTDFRPLCDTETVATIAADAARDTGNALASNDLLLQCLSVWPHISLLSVCGTHSDVSEDALPLVPSALRELRGYGAASLPPLNFPLLERLEWVGLPADKLDGIPAGLSELTLWQLSEALDLQHLEVLRRLVLEVRNESAWTTLRHLPPGLDQLVIYDLEGSVAKDVLLKTIQNARDLRCVTLARRRKHGLPDDNQAEGYDDLAKACTNSKILLSVEIESAAAAPWDVIPRP